VSFLLAQLLAMTFKKKIGGIIAKGISLLFIAFSLVLLIFHPETPSRVKKPLPIFLTDQIESDLCSLQIHEEAIEAVWAKIQKEPSQYVRYKLVKGRFTAATDSTTKNHPRYLVVTEALAKIFASESFPDLDFIVYLGDSLETNPYLHPNNLKNWEFDKNFEAKPTNSKTNSSSCLGVVPIMAFAKPEGKRGIVLIPDCEALNPDDRAYLTKLALQAAQDTVWSKKKQQVFWRGAPTGPVLAEDEIEKDNWIASPRFHLVKLAEQYRENIDAAFVSWNGLKENRKKIAARFSLAPPIHPKDHFPYKYLIDIDGNSCSYSRTYWILLSNSLMLKQMTQNTQWFYKGLKPYVHFVPVFANLSDLEEKIVWCKSHDQEAEKIAQNATAFASEYLQYEENLLYLFHLLKEYATHQQFQPALDDADKKADIPVLQKALFKMKGALRKKIKNQPIA
jgi:Glycosyl transferase family 90